MVKMLSPVAQRRLAALLALFLVVPALLPQLGETVTHAAPPVPVVYDPITRTISVGTSYNPLDPFQAPYVNNPSDPAAPKDPITLPEIAAVLSDTTLLEQPSPKVWQLNANLVVNQTVRLEVTDATATQLRLNSTPGPLPPVSVVAQGGTLLFQDTSVVAWANGAPDAAYLDGRSYMLAASGARMDIIRSEVSFLGWNPGEQSGLAWRLRAGLNGDAPVTPENITRGATGSIIDSNIHDNYFGMYSFQAYKLIMSGSEFHHNVFYGIDPHDDSTLFEVSYNIVHDNGKHGIVFSRGCINNQIHHNIVYANADHGIMMDRGSNNNHIYNNEVYNNGDGVAIFQSSSNVIEANQLHDNGRGVRINATFDTTDVFDGLSNDNIVRGNTITNNVQYGVYLYERADNNTIEDNEITGHGSAGVYIKTGDNRVLGNLIGTNTDGISIVGTTPYTPGIVLATGAPGRNNIIQGNTIQDNVDNGIQMQAAVGTLIGASDVNAPDAAQANAIRTNGTHGISLNGSSTGNRIVGNTIFGNLRDGVSIKGPDNGSTANSKNTIRRNSISANGRYAISVAQNANNGIQPPTILTPPTSTSVGGISSPNATVEVYRDPDGESSIYKGTAVANAGGGWTMNLPAGDDPSQGPLTALATDPDGNTSMLTGSTSGGTMYQLGAGSNGEPTVFISGAGSVVTLPQIQQALQVISPTHELLTLVDPAQKIWQSNVSMFVSTGVTLQLTSDTVSWLRLRSQAGDIALKSDRAAGAYNYKSFTDVRTYNGSIVVDGVKITSWDPTLNTYDTDISDGRSYLLAKYDARMDIKNSELSYLGSADGESYGVSWRDINSDEEPGVLRTRVTGDVLNSTFSNNYYGIYTFQAQNMIFQGNKFHHNIGYGFDPHDFSHHFLIENNEAYANGNHGFIISRGCNNFVFRNNKSYDNRYTVSAEDRNAQGFMLDPGSPNSQFPQVPSHDNLLENNQAYNNDGYGLRIVGSVANTIRNNTFTNNLQGITLEQASTANVISGNTITSSGLYGIYLIGGSDQTQITGNTISHSGKHGIYIKTGQNTISQNILTDNGGLIDGVTSGSGISTLQETTVPAALADLQLPGQNKKMSDAVTKEAAASVSLASAVAGNIITQNAVSNNADEGIELKSAQGTRVEGNTVQSNGSNGVYLANGTTGSVVNGNVIGGNAGYGIRANGAEVSGNTWSENQVFSNGMGGIRLTDGANGGTAAPKLVQEGQTVTGTAPAGSTIELFSDDFGQARYFELRLTVDSSGTFTVTQPWKGAVVNATLTSPSGNSSGLAINTANQRIFLPLVQAP
jgi:parallel beta-helix repeat protein